MEDHQIRELFLELLKQLIVSKPEKPLDFLMDKLSNPPPFCLGKSKDNFISSLTATDCILNIVKRIFVLGPPGSERKEYAKRLKDQFKISLIETGELLKEEAAKDTPDGKKIAKALAAHTFGKFIFL